jgi:hypothetical protein
MYNETESYSKHETYDPSNKNAAIYSQNYLKKRSYSQVIPPLKRGRSSDDVYFMNNSMLEHLPQEHVHYSHPQYQNGLTSNRMILRNTDLYPNILPLTHSLSSHEPLIPTDLRESYSSINEGELVRVYLQNDKTHYPFIHPANGTRMTEIYPSVMNISNNMAIPRGNSIPPNAFIAYKNPSINLLPNVNISLQNLTENRAPIFVNPKQYLRILKRRSSRVNFGVENRIIKNDKSYVHESRHQHAMRRPRGPGGRFLTKAEIQDMKQNTKYIYETASQ